MNFINLNCGNLNDNECESNSHIEGNCNSIGIIYIKDYFENSNIINAMDA